MGHAGTPLERREELGSSRAFTTANEANEAGMDVHHQPVRNAESALTWASAVKYRLSCLPKIHVMLPQKEAKKRKRERAKRTSKKKTRKKKRRKRADEKRRPRGDETRRDETRRKGSGALGRVWGRQGIIPGAGVQLGVLLSISLSQRFDRHETEPAAPASVLCSPNSTTTPSKDSLPLQSDRLAARRQARIAHHFAHPLLLELPWNS
ncbi:hypothetical protein TESG_08612 [Trichophyton tonsurans CBS 112818]|uniref:Uncharacterized protein n=1 Tax=Trichophyton tonsurans (strain CBS 112818) TaxID=647933 RepID=F2S859_TRIT1|nr:hypothetical protein TESG_08612 [Trichophyton tonsurans CBS 112818]